MIRGETGMPGAPFFYLNQLNPDGEALNFRIPVVLPREAIFRMSNVDSDTDPDADPEKKVQRLGAADHGTGRRGARQKKPIGVGIGIGIGVEKNWNLWRSEEYINPRRPLHR
jgi:hypothetical protein